MQAKRVGIAARKGSCRVRFPADPEPHATAGSSTGDPEPNQGWDRQEEANLGQTEPSSDWPSRIRAIPQSAA